MAIAFRPLEEIREGDLFEHGQRYTVTGSAVTVEVSCADGVFQLFFRSRRTGERLDEVRRFTNHFLHGQPISALTMRELARFLVKHFPQAPCGCEGPLEAGKIPYQCIVHRLQAQASTQVPDILLNPSQVRAPTILEAVSTLSSWVQELDAEDAVGGKVGSGGGNLSGGGGAFSSGAIIASGGSAGQNSGGGGSPEVLGKTDAVEVWVSSTVPLPSECYSCGVMIPRPTRVTIAGLGEFVGCQYCARRLASADPRSKRPEYPTRSACLPTAAPVIDVEGEIWETPGAES